MWILVLLLTAGPLAALSDKPKTAAPTAPSPQQQAMEHYNRGLEHQQKAWEYEKKAAEKDREKNLEKARKEYEKALAQHLEATRKNPKFSEAFNSLGYAYRKTGDYPSALKAYDQALALNPEYAEAIEYRGEAYLGLNRAEEAQQAYEWLFLRDPKKAAALLQAVKQWVEERGKDLAGVAPEQLEKVRSWATQKEAAAQELSGVKETGKQEW